MGAGFSWNRKSMGPLISYIKAHRRGILPGSLALTILSVPLVNIWVLQSSKARVFADEQTLPENDVGLVLGVSRWGNPHFKTRTEAAAILYRTGKVKHLLLDLFVLHSRPRFLGPKEEIIV